MNDRELLINKFKIIAGLKYNWNDNGALPLPMSLIEKAKNLALQIEPTPHVYPTANDSIQFEWMSGDLYLEMEIFEDKIEIYSNHLQTLDEIGS